MKFGWPASMSNNGPFWTNDADDLQFLRVMDYLNNVEDREWERIRTIYVPELMEFDPDNTQFQALLARLVSKSVDLVH
jgi:surface carbohydrate biosynthesis protein